MSIDKQSSKMAFVCDVCCARFEAETTDQQPGRVHALWIAAEKLVPDFAEARVSQFLEFRSQMGHLPSISGGTRSSDSGY